MKKHVLLALLFVILTTLVGCSKEESWTDRTYTEDSYDAFEVYDGDFVGYTFLAHQDENYYLVIEYFYDDAAYPLIWNMSEFYEGMKEYELEEENNDTSIDIQLLDVRNILDEWPLDRKLSLASTVSTMPLKRDLSETELKTIIDYIKTFKFKVAFDGEYKNGTALKYRLEESTAFTCVDIIEVEDGDIVESVIK